MKEQYEIWKKIVEFEFPKGFEQRLAKEQGWTLSFTGDAVNEYLKFMFLSKFAGHKVTPSHIVDQVWHLHLIYSESYWDELCGKVLEQKLHHIPGDDGSNEDIRFVKQYEQTLKSYKVSFGEPNEKYWPIPTYLKEEAKPKKKSWLDRLFNPDEDSPKKKNEDSTSNIASSCGGSNYVDSGGGFWPTIFGGGDFGGGGAGGDWGGDSSGGGDSSCSSCGGGCGGD